MNNFYNTQMAKAALESFILDLKLTPEGKVKILEFGGLYYSGYSGYKRLTGESILRTKVFPFYEHWGIPVFQGARELLGIDTEDYRHPANISETLGIMPFGPRDDENFDPGSIESYDAILTYPRPSKEAQRRRMSDYPYNRVLSTNTTPLIAACCEDKAIMAAFAQKFAPDLFPYQKIYRAGPHGILDPARILEDFKGHQVVAVKNTWQARGEGVDVLKLGSLRAAFRMAAGKPYLFFRKKPYLKEGHNCVVQAFTEGMRVKIENMAGVELEYDPTMRMVVTAWHENGKTRIYCHDAYYKLPVRPARGKLSRSNAVSEVHEGDGPKSDMVPDEHFRIVAAQLEAQLPALIGPMMTTPSHAFAREFMNSDDEALRCVGAQIATDERYFDRPADSDQYPDELAAGVFALRDALNDLDGDSIVQGIVSGALESVPEGLQEKLQALDEVAPPLPQPSVLKRLGPRKAIIYSTFAFAAGCFVYGAVRPKEDATISMLKDTLAISQLPDNELNRMNLRLFRIEDAAGKVEGLKAELAPYAEKGGYKICAASEWPGKTESVRAAYRMALDNPGTQFIAVDMDDLKAPPVIKVNEITPYQTVTNQTIYAKNCP